MSSSPRLQESESLSGAARRTIDEYLIGDEKDGIAGFSKDKKLIPLPNDKVESLKNLSKKERTLRFNGFVITDALGNVVFEDRDKYSQHFFPLSVLDYAKAMYDFERHGKSAPILSIDSHDILKCDFKCPDCLSGHGCSFPKEKFPKNNFKMDLETYKGILKSIADYSKQRGFSGVRFEQSGEGNPDLYEHRPEILKYAKELGMESVYFSTGSKIEKDLMDALVENSTFIRMSFPGIENSYVPYSGQENYTFDDAIEKLSKIVKERDAKGRNRELMIGARVALRPDHGSSYFSFADKLKRIGVDYLQIVNVLVAGDKEQADVSLANSDVRDLEKTATLADSKFSVILPYKLDQMFYLRETKNKKDFSPECLVEKFQLFLAGRSLFFCTMDHVMYSPDLKLGTFENKEGELEQFLSAENVESVKKRLPSECSRCSSIYDNKLLFSLQKLYRANPGQLKFYEVIK